MANNKKFHLIIGWIVGALALILYLFSMAPGITFWDSGEFIAVASKLQVGHPPGAPVYLLIARVFSIFGFGNIQSVAFLTNMVSVLSAALTITFLYWTIVLILQRFSNISTIKNDKILKLIVAGSATIGALSFAVSDSFWNAATETEVYALSSLITAVMFWAALRWINEEKFKWSSKWMMFIALMLGLALGTHLLGLLCLPAIVMVLYLARFKIQLKSAIIAVTIAIISPLLVLYVYMPAIIYSAKALDFFAVNQLSLPANSGLLFFATIFTFALALGIWSAYKKQRAILHTALLSVALLSLGFSSYTMILVRSSANTPIDENNPENILNLISYINRDQYGDAPLLYGHMFNSGLDKRNPYFESDPIRKLGDVGYEVVSYKLEPKYVKRDMRVLPRMWSKQPEHAVGYLTWSGADPSSVPGMSENISYFLRYQTGHMYLRYFLWNFAGKQNDLQGHGGPLKGNWISGIGFIDKLRLGVTAKDMQNQGRNAGSNKYYFLPLIFGVIGIVTQFRRDKKGFWVLLTLFVFTGFAIVLYLNQYPFQPRERDYSFLASFYTFSIWIALGTAGLLLAIKKINKNRTLVYATLTVSLLAVPILMLAQNYNDHKRSHYQLARNLAYNILNTCEPNAILFTNGDNDTFPLWYLQEVEGIRTDVRVVNMSYLNLDWYINQCRCAHYNAEPVPMSVLPEKYEANKREYNLVKHNFTPFLDTIYYTHKIEIDRDYSLLMDKLMFTLDESDFQEMSPEKYQQVSREFRNITPHIGNPRFRELTEFVRELMTSESIAAYSIRMDAASDLTENMNIFIQKQSTFPLPLASVLDFVFSDEDDSKTFTLLGTKKMNYVPGTFLSLPIDKQRLISTHTLDDSNIQYAVDKMEWNIDKEMLTKSDLIILDIINTNNWERPIYFVSTAGPSHYLGLEKYFSLEGLAYRLVPAISPVTDKKNGSANPEKLYKNLTQEFRFESFADDRVYLDENMRRIGMNMRNVFARAARDLYFTGQIEKTEEVLDLCLEVIPNSKVAYDYFTVSLVHGYYRINQQRKARELAQVLAKNVTERLSFMLQMDDKYQMGLDVDEKKDLMILQELMRLATEYKHGEYEKEITDQFNKMYEEYAKKKGLYEDKL